MVFDKSSALQYETRILNLIFSYLYQTAKILQKTEVTIYMYSEGVLNTICT